MYARVSVGCVIANVLLWFHGFAFTVIKCDGGGAVSTPGETNTRIWMHIWWKHFGWWRCSLAMFAVLDAISGAYIHERVRHIQTHWDMLLSDYECERNPAPWLLFNRMQSWAAMGQYSALYYRNKCQELSAFVHFIIMTAQHDACTHIITHG